MPHQEPHGQEARRLDCQYIFGNSPLGIARWQLTLMNKMAGIRTMGIGSGIAYECMPLSLIMAVNSKLILVDSCKGKLLPYDKGRCARPRQSWHSRQRCIARIHPDRCATDYLFLFPHVAFSSHQPNI